MARGGPLVSVCGLASPPRAHAGRRRERASPCARGGAGQDTPQQPAEDGGVGRSWQWRGSLPGGVQGDIRSVLEGCCRRNGRTPNACGLLAPRGVRAGWTGGQCVKDVAPGSEHWAVALPSAPTPRRDVPFTAHLLCVLASVTSGASPSPGATDCMLCKPSDSH